MLYFAKVWKKLVFFVCPGYLWVRQSFHICAMERLMQYVWLHRLWPVGEMTTVDGRHVEVLDPGSLNTDAGPDFFNAKIRVGGELWAGNVEVHVRASDWHRHGHDADPAYQSVILHVVDRDDAVIRASDGRVIPQMRMPCNPALNNKYNELVGRADSALPCASDLAALHPLYLSDWVSALAYERLYAKVDRIESLRARLSGDWESTCYVTVARGLGFGVNGDPFERLALSLPLLFIGKHSDSLTSVEALLFGQAGLLTGAAVTDAYASHLKREYDFLSTKFSLRPVESPGWKMARMRPPNFPHRRIAVLAAMLHGGFRMMNHIVSVSAVDEAVALFMPQLSEYWRTHASFGPPMPVTVGTLSHSSALVMVINVVVPLMMAYGMAHGDESMADKAVGLLQEIKPENNSIVRLFQSAGLKVSDAFMSQGLIQLRRNYCEQRKCLYCRIGHRRLSNCAVRPG